MARLVALDVDGTILNSESKLTEPVKQSILNLSQQGVKIIIVTGRNSFSVNRLMGQLGLDLSYVSSAGATIYNAEQKKVIGSYTLSKTAVKPLVEAGVAAGAGLFVEQPDNLLWYGNDEFLGWIEKHGILAMRRLKTPDEMMTQDVLKITFVNYHENHLPLEERIRAMNLPIYMVFSMPIYLEVTAAGINKGAAIEKLTRSLGVELEDVLAVGDSENDLSMFEVAGTAVAMGNANQNVKNAADYVAPSNDEDGLAWVLNNLETVR